MKQRFYDAVNFINEEIETPEYKEHEKKTIQMTAVMMVIVTLLLALINGVKIHNANISVVSVSAVVLFIVAFFFAVFIYNETIVKNMIFLAFVLMFSYILIEGSTNGTAIYWILVLPIVYMTLINFRAGLIIGTYFLVLILLAFWSPAEPYFPYRYPTEVVSRFPLMYIACFAVGILIGVRSKRQILEERHRKEELEEAVIEERHRVQMLSISAITSITNALDAKDPYTHRHSEHVAFYSREIGQVFGLSGNELEELYTAARLHDLGKIGIPDAVLNKGDKLTDEEYELMKTHVQVGASILSAFDTMPGLDVGALYHHERYDGKGYSHGLSGEQIPLFARIIAVADALDAMYTTRTYRDKASKYTVVEQLRAGRGSQFDPQLANIAINLIEGGMLERLEKEFGEV